MGSVNQGPGNGPVFVFGCWKACSQIGGSQIHTRSLSTFFLLQKENIIIKAKLKILIRKKEHKNYLYCHYSQMVIVSVLLPFLHFYSYACPFFFFNKNESILHTTL